MIHTPSFYAHIANGLLVLIAVILLFKNYSVIKQIELIYLILLFSISMGIHSLTHLGLEKEYGYNPLIKL